jgi:hypothetical protein
MAFGIVQKPTNTTYKVPVITNWTPLIGYMVYRDSSISSLFYYKIVLEVYTGTSVVAANLIAKLKQRRNGYSVDVAANYARAFFDLRDIANSVLVNTVFDQNDTGQPFRTIHKVGTNNAAKPYSTNGDRNTGETQIVSLTVKAFENYSSAADESPVDQTGSAVTDTLYYMQATMDLFTDRASDSDYIQGTAFSIYNSSGSTDNFLSDVEEFNGEYNITGRINYVQEDDYHTVAFLNDFTNFSSKILNMQITYYDSSGSTIGSAQEIENTTANGGAIPNSEVDSDEERLLYFGCGPQNLESQSVTTNARPSNFSNWAYYTIQGIETKASPNPKSKLYYFVKQDASCKGYQVRRLAWRNSKGGYDYFNFKAKNSQTVEVKRNNFASMLGTFNKSRWRYNNTQRGKATRQTTAILKETLNTEYITEAEGQLLEKLIMSTDVYIVENNSDQRVTQAIMVTDSSFVRKTVENDNLIQYTIQIEYANQLNTNS